MASYVKTEANAEVTLRAIQLGADARKIWFQFK